jgi:hypothetical protein
VGLVPDSLLAGLSVETAVGQWSNRMGSPPPDRRILVAEVDRVVVAFAVVAASRDEDAAREAGELTAMYAKPQVWGSSRTACRCRRRSTGATCREDGVLHA